MVKKRISLDPTVVYCMKHFKQTIDMFPTIKQNKKRKKRKKRYPTEKHDHKLYVS